jgi:two-component system, cell cycle response regulator
LVPTRKVALLGFTAFERATFETFFRLASRRTPAYVYAETLEDCELVIADSDRESVMVQLAGFERLDRVLLVGSFRRGGALQLPRPMNLMAVLRALDRLAEPNSELYVVTDGVPQLPAPKTPALPELPAPGGADAVTEAGVLVTEPAELEPSSMDHILVVDDSDVALRFMTKRLNRFGYEIHLARSGEEALRRMDGQQFEFVFLDVMMDGMDGYQTCKLIKKRNYPQGRPPPTVVMVTSLNGEADKMRGTLAGCDAYLTKPLVDNELLKIIGDREVVKHQFADTTRTTP